MQTLEEALKRYQSKDGSSSFILERDGKLAGLGSVREMECGTIKRMNGEIALDKAADMATVMEYVAKVKADGSLNQHLINYTITTETLDRSNDIIKADGVMLDKYKRNNVLFWNHWSWSMPIGNGYNAALIDKSVNMDFNFHGLNDSETWSETVGLLCLSRVIKACSVGVIPLAWDDLEIDENLKNLYPTIYPSYSNKIRIYKKCEMYECSPCSVPMNPDAVQAAFGKEFDEEVKAMVAKGVLSAENPFLTFVSRAKSHGKTNIETGEEKAGRKISAANLEKIKKSHSLLDEIIAEAEPLDDGEGEGSADATPTDTNKSSISAKQYDRDMKSITASLAEVTTTLKHLSGEIAELRTGKSAESGTEGEPEGKSGGTPKPSADELTDEKMLALLNRVNVQ